MAEELKGAISMDTTDAKASIGYLDRAIRVLETSFKANAAALGEWSKTSEGNEQRIKSLSQVIDLQKQKIANWTAEYEKIVNEQGKASAAAQKLEIKINKETEALNKNEKEVKDCNERLDKMVIAEKQAEQATENLGKEIDKTADKTKKMTDNMEKVGSKMSDIGGKMTLGLTMPLVAAGGAAFKFASDTNEMLDKTDSVFKGSANGIKTWSKNSIDTLGIARSTTLDLASTFGTMSVSMGQTTSEAADMSKEILILARDIASLNNTNIREVANALSGIWTGETEALKKYGAVMTETNLKEFAMQKGYKKSIADLTQLEKIELRRAYVMQAATVAKSNYTDTQESAANQTEKLKESLKELASTFGTELLPVITPIIKNINEAIKSFGKLDSSTKQTVIQVGGLLAISGPLLGVFGKITSGIGGAINLFQKGKISVDKWVSSVRLAENGTKSFSKNVVKLGDDLKGTAGLIGVAIGLLMTLIKFYDDAGKNLVSINGNIIDEKYSKLAKIREKEHSAELKKIEDEMQLDVNKNRAAIDLNNKKCDNAIKNLDKELKAKKKAIDDERKSFEEAHKKRIAEIEEERRLQLEEVDKKTNDEIGNIQAEIDKIDAITTEEEKAERDRQNFEKTIELQDKIKNAKTVEEKRDLENELKEHTKKVEREKTLEVREQAKEQLNIKISQAQERADKEKLKINEVKDEEKTVEDKKLEDFQTYLDLKIVKLDTFITDSTAIIEANREKENAKLQEDTLKFEQEYDKRIEKINELKKSAEETEQKLKETEKQSVEISPWDKFLRTFGLYDLSKETEKLKEIDGVLPGGEWYTRKSGKKRATGDSFWEGGYVTVNERGGEILRLPRGTQIIPTDISSQMADGFVKQAYKQQASQVVYQTNQFGAQQQVIKVDVDGRQIARIIQPTISKGISDDTRSLRRAMGI